MGIANWSLPVYLHSNHTRKWCSETSYLQQVSATRASPRTRNETEVIVCALLAKLSEYHRSGNYCC